MVILPKAEQRRRSQPVNAADSSLVDSEIHRLEAFELAKLTKAVKSLNRYR